ncbi:helix-turn-helix domain-containing protein [Aristophania vespae]|uniref:helix-turn-helix domain-containing protein n=1 Tax=Aristophania vespae TaxID=2697033 RepID=UPI002351BA5D|nr:helix-turn-helix domain-containing protein [Aristophania vespae]
MNRSPIADRIESLMHEQGLNKAEVSRRSGVSRVYLTDLFKGKSREPRRSNIIKIAKALGVTVDSLYRDENIANRSNLNPDKKENRFFGDAIPYVPQNIENINVIGAVQAGIFTEALEWEYDKRYHIRIPIDDGYSLDFNRYALEVRGESMNRIFPNGSLICVIDFSELGRSPQTGDYVTVMRRDAYGAGFETTVKALQIREDGSYCLWPRSTDPSFQQPFIITSPESDTDFFDPAGAPDIQVKGLVVGTVRTRLKAVF